MFIKLLGILLLIVVIGYSIIPTGISRIKRVIANKQNKKLQISVDKKEKIIYLTFDDGPDKKFTCNLLDLLKEYNVKASFFVIAKFAEENQDIIKRMKKEGHLIGYHSFEHKNALWQSPRYMKHDFENSKKIFENLGVNIHYFRPPWGHFNIQTLICRKQYKFKTVLWNVMAEDWRGNAAWQEIAGKLIERTGSGDIVCLHDGRGKNDAPSRTIEALKSVIPIWISKGYSFATVDEL